MTGALLWVTAATLALGLTGCGGRDSATDATAPTHSTHTMADGTVMDGATMTTDASPALPPGKGRPSSIARMVCSAEIADTVRRTFELDHRPAGLHVWTNHDYRCLFPLGTGQIRLSVKDLDAEGPGRAYFDHLRATLPDPATLGKLESYGLPGFSTTEGDVVLIKDHKTLWVDATEVNASDLPSGMTREHAAYILAANVIACWTG